MPYFVVALAPFIALLGAVFVFRQTIAKSAVISLLVTTVTVLYFWQMTLVWFAAASLKGLYIVFEIGLILVSAILFYRLISTSTIPSSIHSLLSKYLPDRYLQAILLGFFLVSLIEGAAGFGTPALIVAPLLLTLRFHPHTAILLTLIGGAGAVTFGALGTPLLVGVVQGLPFLSSEQTTSLIVQSGNQIGVANLLSLFCTPFILTLIVKKLESPQIPVPLFKIALSSSVFVLVYYLVSRFSLELPTLLASIIGLFALLIIGVNHRAVSTIDLKKVFFVASPYLFIVVLLLLTRLHFLPFFSLLRQFSISHLSIFGSSLSYTFYPLLSPSLILLLASIYVHYFAPSESLISSFRFTISRAIKPLLILLTLSVMVQLLINSYANLSGLTSIPQYLGLALASSGLPWFIIAPLAGLLGAFTTGSATVSNLLFSSLSYQLSQSLSLSVLFPLTLQAIGAAAGNMFALHNFIAVSSVVASSEPVTKLLRTLFFVALFYTALAVISLCAVYYL